MFVNCLLKACAFCLFVVAVWLLNVIVMLLCCLVFLFVSPAMVFHNMCVLFLWSQFCVRCCFHSSCLCCCIMVSMFLLSSWSCGSLGFCCLVVFLCCMRVRMFSGSSFCVLCILPFGMWCLSACRIMLVSMLFAVCTLSGMFMLSSACSISCVNSVQFALW